jgi:hypothetical protein
MQREARSAPRTGAGVCGEAGGESREEAGALNVRCKALDHLPQGRGHRCASAPHSERSLRLCVRASRVPSSLSALDASHATPRAGSALSGPPAL